MKFHVQQNLVSFFFVFFFPFLFGRKIYRGGIIINAYHSVSDVRIFHVIPSPVDVSSNYACRACSSSSRVILAVNEYKLMFLKLYSLLLNIALRNRDLIIDNQNFIYLREKNLLYHYCT